MTSQFSVKPNHQICTIFSISIIIPTLNEEDFIQKLIPHLKDSDTSNYIKEIIVVDAGSKDKTVKLAKHYGAMVIDAHKGRAIQMNAGAQVATGNILHFIHADAFPPYNFTLAICKAIEETKAGCFRSLFDTKSKFLKFNSFFTRFSGTVFRGGGQTLFINRDLFYSLGGYDENLDLMEEYDLIQRIKKKSKFKVIQEDVLVSARDYEKYGNWKLQSKYAVIYFFFFLGFSKEIVKWVYQVLMKVDKA